MPLTFEIKKNPEKSMFCFSLMEKHRGCLLVLKSVKKLARNWREERSTNYLWDRFRYNFPNLFYPLFDQNIKSFKLQRKNPKSYIKHYFFILNPFKASLNTKAAMLVCTSVCVSCPSGFLRKSSWRKIDLSWLMTSGRLVHGQSILLLINL